MILTFVTLTNDINKVPKWECSKEENRNFAHFIKTSAFPKRIMVLGPSPDNEYNSSEITEVRPGIFISKMELPYTELSVAGDDLRPFIGGYDPANDHHKNAVVIIIDRSVYTYLDVGVGPSSKEVFDTDTVIVNTFHAKDWVGCIAMLGEDFERKGYEPKRMVSMYIDYAINGAPKSKMLHEMHIKGNPKGISITDGLVVGRETPKKLMYLINAQKKQTFRIRTAQRLSNIIIVPEDVANEVCEMIEKTPADYLTHPYNRKFVFVPVDKDRTVIETEDVKNNLLSLFDKKRGNNNKSCIFYDCRPSKVFFQVNLSYMFVANEPKKDKLMSYYSIICP